MPALIKGHSRGTLARELKRLANKHGAPLEEVIATFERSDGNLEMTEAVLDNWEADDVWND